MRLAAAIREFLRSNPGATLVQVCAATGASNNLATSVRQKIQAEGALAR